MKLSNYFWKICFIVCLESLKLNYFYTFLCVLFLFSSFSTCKNIRDFWKNLFFAKITFANFSFNFLQGIKFRENGQKLRKFLPTKGSALKLLYISKLRHSSAKGSSLKSSSSSYDFSSSWTLAMISL